MQSLLGDPASSSPIMTSSKHISHVTMGSSFCTFRRIRRDVSTVCTGDSEGATCASISEGCCCCRRVEAATSCNLLLPLASCEITKTAIVKKAKIIATRGPKKRRMAPKNMTKQTETNPVSITPPSQQKRKHKLLVAVVVAVAVVDMLIVLVLYCACIVLVLCLYCIVLCL